MRFLEKLNFRGRTVVPSAFDELIYLDLNPDVEAAVRAGVYASGYEHWKRHGRHEKRFATKPSNPPNATVEWNEYRYLRANPDVAKAVIAGSFRSGFDHWTICGMEEERPGGPPEAAVEKAAPRAVLEKTAPGFNVFGYASAQTGLGSGTRGYVDTLRAISDRLHTVNVPLWGADPRPEPGFDSTRIPYAFNVIHQNPDILPLFFQYYGRRTLRDRINIGCWVWELHAGYPAWNRLSRLFHEIWVPSSYVAESLSSVSAAPLCVIPHPVAGLPAEPAIRRGDLGLPEGAFLFLYIFDLASTLERKNPIALIRAFHDAFGDRSDACLVLKYHNVASDPKGAEMLERLVSGRANVRVLNQTLPSDHVHGLLQMTDCFVSPHRSEGFGLNIASAMYYGKPVIATGYSGNMDYMDGGTAYLIDYDLVPVGPGNPHYREHYAWADPDVEHLASLLLRVFSNPERSQATGLAGQALVRKKFSLEAVSSLARARVEAFTGVR